MLTRLSLTNFQGWDTLDLPLGPITVVIGETNAGKSSIVRALSCVLFNGMTGQAMIRHGQKSAEVAVETSHGDTVRWVRSASVNRFLVNERVFDKVGVALPPDVAEALNIRELTFDGESVRLQWAPQMDAPFLLADAGAKATRMLSVAGKAAIVAQAAKLAQGESRQRNEKMGVLARTVAELETVLEGFRYLDDATSTAEALEQSLSTLSTQQARRTQLQQSLDQWRQVEITRAQAESAVAHRAIILGLATHHEQTMQVLVAARAKRDQLALLRTDMVRHWDKLQRGQAQLAALTAQVGIANRRVVAYTMRETLVQLQSARTMVATLEVTVLVAQQDVVDQTAAYQRLLAEATCPTCGRVA